MVVIAADLLERWLQPTPDVTAGEATVSFSGDAVAQVRSAAFASAPFGSSAVVAVRTLGSAEFVCAAVVAQAPAVAGSASAGFDGDVEPIEASVTRGSADVFLDGLAQARVAGFAVAAFGILQTGATALPVDASAEVGFADYGGGSAPILPFKLPVSFTDNLLNVQDAAAKIVVSGAGVAVRVGVVGSAVPRFDGGFGSTLPVAFPFEFGANVMLGGSTPIFPHLLAAVFDQPANDNAGAAVADVEAVSEVVVPVGADASAAISAPAVVYRRAIFPMLLPVSFTAGDQLAEAVVAVVQSESSFPLILPFAFGTNVEVPVVGRALVDFHVPGLVGRGVFPYQLPVVF